MPKSEKILKSSSKLKPEKVVQSKLKKVKKTTSKVLLASSQEKKVVSKKIIPIVSKKSKLEEILADKKTLKITPSAVASPKDTVKSSAKSLSVIVAVLLVFNLFMMLFVGAVLTDRSNRIALRVNNLLSRVDILETRERTAVAADTKLTSVDYQPKLTSPDKITDNYFGDENARYVWINYSDLQCPYSALIFPELTSMARQDKRLAIVNRHYPLTSIHPMSLLFSEAAECAANGDQAKFWQMSELIYQNGKNLDFDKIVALAVSIGVDEDSFVDCLNNHQSLPKIQLDYAEAVTIAGQNGSPTGVLYDTQTGRNKLVVGYMPRAQIKIELEKFISEGANSIN
jgi:protein-disulfide isomerase